MITERFNHTRLPELETAFRRRKIKDIWKNLVRQKIRKLDIKDIFDYFDFNYYIDNNIEHLRSNILNGTYKPQLPLIYEIEKKHGITRHMVIPQPSDILLLQTITEFVSSSVLSNAPSKKAFYSRDKDNIPHMKDLEPDEDFYLPTRELWKIYQKDILKFSQNKKYLVITDLSNYYDSIRMRDLRSVISNHTNINEVFLDLLFFIIEDISWLPDYLPYPEAGLPTINIEAIRMVAHTLLFEADAVLSANTDDTFARWMDDITFGVDHRRDGLNILNKLSAVLKSRGLALNLSKTQIIHSSEADNYFLFDENVYLNKQPEYPTTSKKRNDRILKETKLKFRQHLKNRSPKLWGKVTMRYLTFFAKWHNTYPLNIISSLYKENPSLRSHIAYYLKEIGPMKKCQNIMLDLFNNTPEYDDVSFNHLISVLLHWDFPVTPTSIDCVKHIESIIWKSTRDIRFYYLLQLYGKYKSSADILDFISKYENKWKTSPFLRRQALALTSRTIGDHRAKTEKILMSSIHSGITEVISLANNIRELSEISEPDNRIRQYLFYGDPPEKYPFNKFLILKTVLSSQNLKNRKYYESNANKYVQDRFYRKWLSI